MSAQREERSERQRVNFDDIKAGADFLLVLKHFGVELPRVRDAQPQIKVRCPFHDDTEPSLSVNLSKNVFQCFSNGCPAHKGGSVLDFVMLKEGIGVYPAAVKVGQICVLLDGSEGATERQEPPQGQNRADRRQRRQGRSNAPSAADEGAINPVITIDLKLQTDHPYLLERVPDADARARFGLGFCNRGMMQGRVAAPIHNAEGGKVGYWGRWAGEEPSDDAKYLLPSSEKGFMKSHLLYNLHRVIEADPETYQLVIVEGFFQAIEIDTLRFPVVSTMGSCICDEQVALLGEHMPKLQEVLVIGDGDEAGAAFNADVMAKLGGDLWVRFAEMPEGMDVDSMEYAALMMRMSQAGIETHR